MAQQWEISEPKLLDVGGADERVAALSVALIGGHVDVVTHDDTGAATADYETLLGVFRKQAEGKELYEKDL